MEDLTVDHVQGVAVGGLNLLSNYVTRCRSCNGRKGIEVEKAVKKAADKQAVNTHGEH